MITGHSLTMYGRLFHQYLVDQWAKIEMGRLNYLKKNQQKLRIDLYSGLMDVMQNLGETKDIGKITIITFKVCWWRPAHDTTLPGCNVYCSHVR